MPFKDREYARQYERDRYRNNPEVRRRLREAYVRNYDPERERNRHYLRAYGITLDDYNVMLKEQNGVCKICKLPPTPTKRFKHLQIDHCHKTGRIRGLLCFKCNKSLGWFENTRDIIMEYIK